MASIDHNLQNTASRPVTIKACGSTYIVFGVIFGVLVLLALLPLVFGRRTSPELLGLCLLAMAFSFFWIASFKLTYGAGAISYRTLFSGTKELSLSEIAGAYVEAGYAGDSQWREPPLRLVLKSRNVDKRHVSINLKVFCKQDLECLEEFMNKRLSYESTSLVVSLLRSRRSRKDG
jgi:hypothetical protein